MAGKNSSPKFRHALSGDRGTLNSWSPSYIERVAENILAKSLRSAITDHGLESQGNTLVPVEKITAMVRAVAGIAAESGWMQKMKTGWVV